MRPPRGGGAADPIIEEAVCEDHLRADDENNADDEDIEEVQCDSAPK